MTRYKHPNAYSIAEILLVFSIIAGVLIGLWMLYDMIGDDVGAKALISEVQMLRQAATDYKEAPTNQKRYRPDHFTSSGITALKPYLGDRGMTVDGRSSVGSNIEVEVVRQGYLQIKIPRIRKIAVCRKALGNFGEVVKHSWKRFYLHESNRAPGFLAATKARVATEYQMVQRD